MRTKLIPVACAVMALVLIGPAAATATTFTVNTTADSTVPGGCTTDPACSLRDALTAATASEDLEDTIVVPAGTYAVEAGQLELNDAPTAVEESVTLRGAGARSTTIDARGASRVIEVAGDKVTIEGVTITGGNATEIAPGEELTGDGGGILAYEVDELILNAVNLSGNTASQNGGGIAAPPEGAERVALTISNSTIANNKVTGGLVEALGGGVYALGDLSLTNTTVTGNSAEGVGTVQGGGVVSALDPTDVEPTKLDVLNSTIANNSVGASGIGGGLAVYNPTPGIVTQVAVKNTIVAGNTGPMGSSDCGGVSMPTSDHNLASDGSCMFTDPGSKQSTAASLGALANNGGETDTLALLEGSAAIDAGTNDGCPPADQRGVSRPQGPTCDIGAYERAAPSPPPPAAAAANLRLRIKPKPKRPLVGGKLAFIVTVANRGPSTATGVIVKGTVPALTRKVRGPKFNGKRPCKVGKVKGGKRKLTCRLGSIAAGKLKKLRVVVKTENAGKVRVRARVRSGTPDPNLKDNKARRGVKVRP